VGGCGLHLETGVGAFTGKRDPQEVEGLLDLAQGLLERDLVPAGDHPVRRGADAEDEASVRSVGQGRGLLCQQRRTPLEDTDDAGAEAHVLGPRGA